MGATWKKALLGAVVAVVALAAWWGLTRCRVPFLPFIVDAAGRESRVDAGSPPPEAVLALSGIPSASLFQADSISLLPAGETGRAVHVGLYTTGGYLPVEYLVACQLSGTVITQLTATPWDAGRRNGAYTIRPVESRLSGTPFVAIAWYRSLPPLESEHVRLMEIGLDPVSIREVWRNDVQSSSGGGVFMEESMTYAFSGLVSECQPGIRVRKACTGDDCTYTTRHETWIWGEGARRFILASAKESRE